MTNSGCLLLSLPLSVFLPIALPLSLCLFFRLSVWADVELEQIDFIDSCVGEEEEEEGRSRVRGGGDGTSLSSQFMAYIERRITREVQAPSISLKCGCICASIQFKKKNKKIF